MTVCAIRSDLSVKVSAADSSVKRYRGSLCKCLIMRLSSKVCPRWLFSFVITRILTMVSSCLLPTAIIPRCSIKYPLKVSQVFREKFLCTSRSPYIYSVHLFKIPITFTCRLSLHLLNTINNYSIILFNKTNLRKFI